MLAAAADGAGGIVLLEGPAGAGKTALLDAARDAAQDAGLLVLAARGAELERSFGLGVVRQLFDDVLRDPAAHVAALLTGAARFAAPLLGIQPGPAAPEDPFAARHALYWLTANLATQAPLAMLVDDAHWADATSLEVLAHVANRLDGIGVALVVASRPETTEPAIDALRREAGARRTLLRLAPLGAESSAAVVRSIAPAADDAVCRACHTATGGNPFLLHELARAIRDGAVAPDRVLDQSPESVTREIAARLARLPDAAGTLARAGAVLGGGVALHRAARLAGLDDAEAAAAADALVAAGLLGSAHPLEFLHPLVRAAVYAGIGPAARAAEHARAARLLAAEGESPERVAAQLLRCHPAGDLWAFERLVAAAGLAAARGAADAVATYLCRALEEPPPPELRADVLLDLATAEAHRDPVTAVPRLREALAGDIAVERRFQATTLLAGVLAHVGRVAEAADVLEGQFDWFARSPRLRGPAEAALANITRIDPATRPRAARVLVRLRERVAEGDRDPAVLGTIAAEMGMAGEPAQRLADVAERAVAGAEGSAATAAGWSWYNAVRSLVVAGRYDLARRALDDALARARERGAVIDVGGALTFRGELLVHVGDLAGAEIDARTLRQIAIDCQWPLALGWAAASLGEVLVERGELDEAQRAVTEGPFASSAAALPHVYSHVMLLGVRGRLALEQSRPEAAAEELRECGRRALALEHVNPAVVPWRSLLARALVALGRLGEARRLADEELVLARAFGGRRAIGVALGGTAACAQEGAVRVRRLREAVAVLDGSGARLEQARAQADLGAALRAAGEAEGAREPLRLAIDLAHRCGALAVEERALAELRATGSRPRRRAATGAGALTPSERRIAELAADGQQNREIAQALFVTTATVEYHLRNAYKKLGIGSRAALAGALGPRSIA
jgi:DNA-binding CsgD family transcriptional regulator